eukprot:1173582-Prorocentrum_minimum.AAC.2
MSSTSVSLRCCRNGKVLHSPSERLLKQRELRRTRSSVSLSQEDERHPSNWNTPLKGPLFESHEDVVPESPPSKQSLDSEGDFHDSEGSQRLLIVANRLPVCPRLDTPTRAQQVK